MFDKKTRYMYFDHQIDKKKRYYKIAKRAPPLKM